MIKTPATGNTHTEHKSHSGKDGQVHIGRQPILNRFKKIFGYELLFRRGDTNGVNVTDNMQATASVMVNTLNNIGISRLIGDKIGFINVDDQVLGSGVVDLLPGKSTVLELLETVKMDERVVELCARTKKNGYQFALDDFTAYDPAFEGMFRIATGDGLYFLSNLFSLSF